MVRQTLKILQQMAPKNLLLLNPPPILTLITSTSILLHPLLPTKN